MGIYERFYTFKGRIGFVRCMASYRYVAIGAGPVFGLYVDLIHGPDLRVCLNFKPEHPIAIEFVEEGGVFRDVTLPTQQGRGEAMLSGLRREVRVLKVIRLT